jgi:hydroxymethylglutaryl-CoA lyase
VHGTRDFFNTRTRSHPQKKPPAPQLTPAGAFRRFRASKSRGDPMPVFSESIRPTERPRATIVEVGPRDGLQNERVMLTTEQKLELIHGLVEAGLKHIEVGSFVSPRWIPQMADTAELLRRLPRRDGVTYWVLVPNEKGLELGLQAGMTHMAVFLSSSESHNRKNLNRTIQESLEGIQGILAAAKTHGIVARGYVSTVFGCPYEGDVSFDRVMDITGALLDAGCWQVSLGDTTGMGTPLQVQRGCARAVEVYGADRVALHLHDTRGVGLANALSAWEVGMRTFDSSVGGMGGCPYAPGAAGNLGTEDIDYMFRSSGIETGIDRDRLLDVSRRLELDWGATLNSAFYRYARAGKSPQVSH